MSDYQYYRSAFRGHRLPLAWVDLDRLDQNAADIAATAGGKTIRVASKSLRCRAMIERILGSHPQYCGVMSFTADETLYLLDHGLDDILIAYPVVHIPHLQALAERAAAGAQVWLMVDSPEHIDLIQNALTGSGHVLPICLDIDMSVDFPGLHFGVWRSPLRSMADLRRLVSYAQRASSVSIRGVMGYEAQIAGVGDAVPGKWLMNRIIRMLKSRSLPRIAEFREQAVRYLQAEGIDLDVVNGGGTGSLNTTTMESVVSEVTVGSGFYSPHLFDNYRHFQLQPAAGYAIPVTRMPRAQTFTCLGGGYPASGAADATRAPQPYLPAGARLTSLEGAGEVQTPIEYSGPESLAPGDPILMRHGKAGELCERFDTLHLVQDGRVVDTVPTYRGEGCCFL